MTDNEIIKALEWNISKFGKEVCFGYMDKDGCKKVDAKDILDIINRKKAENERLKINLKAVIDERADHTEAIKEFAERLNDRIINFPSVYQIENATLAFLNGSSHRQLEILEILEIINNLVKEYEKGR